MAAVFLLGILLAGSALITAIEGWLDRDQGTVVQLASSVDLERSRRILRRARVVQAGFTLAGGSAAAFPLLTTSMGAAAGAGLLFEVLVGASFFFRHRRVESAG